MAFEFVIPDANLAALHKVLERIGRRAIKLGFAQPKVTIGEREVARVSVNTVSDNASTTHGETMFVHRITLEGEQPVLSGWRFIGKIEHLDTQGNNVVKGDVPKEYFACSPNCDHCEKKRSRSETFILAHVKTEELKQVGRTCLTDFFNGDDPMRHAGMFEQIWILRDELRELQEYQGGGRPVADCHEVLTTSAAIIRVYGYLSAQKAEELMVDPTSTIVKDILFRKGKCPSVLPDDESRARLVAEWISSPDVQAQRSDSQYFSNLCAIAELGAVDAKNVGLLVSAVAAHERALARKFERENASASGHIGVVDQKLESLPVSVVSANLLPPDQFGQKTLYKFADESGNIIVWFSSGESLAAVGEKLHLNATIKKHDQYRDIKQTNILRASSNEKKLLDAIQMRRDAKTIDKLLKEPLFLDHRSSTSRITALMAAALEGDDVSVRKLLEKGANPDTSDRYGNTAAHFAAANAYEAVIDILEEYGADLELVNADSESAMAIFAEKAAGLKTEAAKVVSGEVAEANEWAQQRFYPLDKFGDKAGWKDFFIEESAKREAEGKFTIEVEKFIVDGEIIILETAGNSQVLDGKYLIAAAINAGMKYVPAIVGQKVYEVQLPLERISPSPAENASNFAL